MSTAPTPARAEESAPGHPSVREVMHAGVIEVPAQATIGDRDDYPVGIVSSLDVAAAVAEDSSGT